MAFPNGPFGGPASEPTGQPVQSNAEVEQLKKQLDEMNAKFEAQRNLLLQTQTTNNQEINLLRRQLSDTVSQNRGQHSEPTNPPQTDDWMSYLTSNNPQAQQAPSSQPKPLTQEDVRRLFLEHEQAKEMAHAQERQKVAELDARFHVEHPDLAKDPNAVALIRNQFLALSQVRPDLSAEQRYQFAVDNVRKDVLPNLKIPAAPAKEKSQPKPQTNNPYMPNVFAAPPGRSNVSEIFGMVDHTPMEEKFSAREKELLQWQQNRNKSFFGG